MLLVVFYHLFLVERKFSGFDTLLPDVLQFGMFGVDLFFVISGFVMVTVTRGKFQSSRQALLFLYNRVSRIYPLYWVYSTLALVVFFIQPSWVNSSQGNQVNIIESFLLLPSNLLPLVQVGWTLIHEMYFYIVYFFILLLLSENLLAFAVGGWGICLVIFNLSFASTNPIYNLIFNPLTFEFLGGCFLAIVYHSNWKNKMSGGLLLAVSAIALIFAVLSYLDYLSVTGAPPGEWWRVLIYGLPALIIVSCLVYAEQKGFFIHSFISKIGDISYSIYLSHLFTINVIGRIWKLITVDQLYDNAIFVLFTLTAVILVGFLSYSLVENTLLKISRKLIYR